MHSKNDREIESGVRSANKEAEKKPAREYHILRPLGGGGWFTVCICDSGSSVGAVLRILLDVDRGYPGEYIVRVYDMAPVQPAGADPFAGPA